MNILNENYNPSDFLTPELQILQIKTEAKSIYQKFYDGVKNSTELFWNNSYFTPEQMAQAAGNSAAELFQLHSIALTALEQAMPGSTAGLIALIKPHVINEDGSVTIL
jgi:hypothetical protein